MTPTQCPQCGAALTYQPPARSVSTSARRLLLLLPIACLVAAYEFFDAAVSPYAIIAAVAVGLVIYAVPAWRAHRGAGPGYLSCESCKGYRVEAPMSDPRAHDA